MRNEKTTITMRVKVDHKESLKAWSERLGISLTQLYMILVGQVGPAELNKLVLTEFACKHLQRLGLPLDAIPIISTSPHAHNMFCFLLSCSAKMELAELTGDLETAGTMARQMETAEVELLRAFGAAVKEYYPQVSE
ncbi:hypothetical protein FUA23_03060 [Neolewinella aurantiaca]|uniref:Uncharacterized protein n=1 Tax=Neolewinella aurantiaca TaxID=2602767 RepID=A0A5C7FSZ0_9BACT|nr:hypothetical protein [Neolewinella aurantiaca]TXF91217.1 hypothetical protein FUA23_03060 [Neolewinella aurantiaca]